MLTIRQHFQQMISQTYTGNDINILIFLKNSFKEILLELMETEMNAVLRYKRSYKTKKIMIDKRI